MRLLQIALLLLNAVFFGYTQLIGPPAARPAADSATAIPPLVLLSESKRPPATSCRSIGPFLGDTARAASQWLAQAHFEARERSVETDGPASYHVVLTVPTLQRATRIAAQLKADDVTDVEVVPPSPGGTQATVSLGLYSDRAHAQARVAALKRHGVAASVVEQVRRASQKWLDLLVAVVEPPPDLAALKASVAAATGVTIVPCPAAISPAAPATSAPLPKEVSPEPPPAKLPHAPA